MLNRIKQWLLDNGYINTNEDELVIECTGEFSHALSGKDFKVTKGNKDIIKAALSERRAPRIKLIWNYNGRSEYIRIETFPRTVVDRTKLRLTWTFLNEDMKKIWCMSINYLYETDTFESVSIRYVSTEMPTPA